jgi:hypothetical protein
MWLSAREQILQMHLYTIPLGDLHRQQRLREEWLTKPSTNVTSYNTRSSHCVTQRTHANYRWLRNTVNCFRFLDAIYVHIKNEVCVTTEAVSASGSHFEHKSKC